MSLPRNGTEAVPYTGLNDSRPLLYVAAEQNRPIHIVILPALVADGDRAVKDIKRPMADNIPRIAPQLRPKLIAVGMSLIVRRRQFGDGIHFEIDPPLRPGKHLEIADR